MQIKYLILIGRTFVATFILVNLFNIIPLNFGSNAWYLQVTMLLVDTCSLLLLGLASLKLVAFLTINSAAELSNESLNEKQNQKYQKNIKVINKCSSYFMYLFIFVAILQIFVVPNGLYKLDILYSERLVRIEKQYRINQDRLKSESQIKLENNIDPKNLDLVKKNRAFEVLKKQKNTAISFLVRDATKVFLMSLVWAYGFFKLSKF